jgi:hypothetical protein
MTPTNLKLLRDYATLANLSDPLSKVVVYKDGVELASAEPVVATPPVVVPPVVVPVPPANVTRISKTTDNIDLNAKPNWTYILEGPVTATKKQFIKKDGISIQCADANAYLDCGAKWLDFQFQITGKGCSVRNLRVCGHDGAVAFALVNTAGFTLENVQQFVHPIHKGGVTTLSADDSIDLIVRKLTTERTGKYSIYLGDSSTQFDHVNGLIEDFALGPCLVVEDEKSSGLWDVKHRPNPPQHGGGWSEHCLRIYGAKGFMIRRGKMSNPKNVDGKQAFKLMSGDGVTIEDVVFEGSTRFGNDINDPKTNKLKNVNVTRCTFNEWVRLDTGADVAFKDSTMPQLIDKGGKSHLVNCTVGGKQQ